MNDSIAILGRQPELGFAELESLYGSDKIAKISHKVALIHLEPSQIEFKRLGGSVKLCHIIATLQTTDWEELTSALLTTIPEHTKQISPGKLHLGLSVYGLKVSPNQILASGLRIKKSISELIGHSIQLVPNKDSELNTAQVIHNKLMSNKGMELIIVGDSNQTLVAQTIAIQDIESYGLRDFGRPYRNPRIGMLPPKLAQIIINLATGPDEPPTPKTDKSVKTILDPFCGTGVLLQEAALMGYAIYGNDIEPRMVEATKQNLRWLVDLYKITQSIDNIFTGDSISYRWKPTVDFVASETYLGRPFTSLPTAEILSQTVSDCNVIINKFLNNIYPQLKPGTRLCLAVPAWQTKAGQFVHLPLIDRLRSMGYNRLSFEHVRNDKLLYYRDDQIVARELLILVRS
jgi:tRNA G10  N-methylase Trm11